MEPLEGRKVGSSMNLNGCGRTAAGDSRSLRRLFGTGHTLGGMLCLVVRSRNLEFGIPGRKTDARFAVLLGTGTVGTVGNGHTLICLVVTYPLSCE
jgi:hypothetical protein